MNTYLGVDGSMGGVETSNKLSTSLYRGGGEGEVITFYSLLCVRATNDWTFQVFDSAELPYPFM